MSKRPQQATYNADKSKTHISLSIDHIVNSTVNVKASPRGDLDTFDYRVQSLHGLTLEEISLWHDIPIFPTNDSKLHNIVNMVNEVIKIHS